jgi:hypothetical protein
VGGTSVVVAAGKFDHDCKENRSEAAVVVEGEAGRTLIIEIRDGSYFKPVEILDSSFLLTEKSEIETLLADIN